MPSNYTEYEVQLYDKRLNQAINDDSGLYMVLQAGVPLKQTCYSNMSGTSLTLPGTMTDGRFRFFTASTVTSVDVSILTASGRSYFLAGLTPSQHNVEVDTEQLKYTLVGAWAILSAHGDGTVSAVAAPVSGGLPAGIRIKDVYIHKTSVGVGVGAGLLLDFGVSGDPDGFIDGATATATGYFLNNVLASGSLVGLTQTRGVLLASFGTTFWTTLPYMISLVTTTNNLVFQITATSALTTVAGSRGYVYYEYDLIPTAGNAG